SMAQLSPHISETGPFFVHSQFGGRIFGFDVDQNGREGILSEAQDLSSGGVLAAVETFDQETGQIIRVMAMTQTPDEFVPLDLGGNGVGLIEYEHVTGFLDVHRFFPMIDPLSLNQFTSLWTPPVGSSHLVDTVSRSQGVPRAAVFAVDVSGGF